MNKLKSNPPKTLLTITIGFSILFIIIKLNWLLYCSIIIGIIGISSNLLSKYVEKIWFKLAELFGLIIPNILLTIIFYLFLFPISSISKIFNKDLLSLKNNNKSNYKLTNKSFDEKSFINPW